MVDNVGTLRSNLWQVVNDDSCVGFRGLLHKSIKNAINGNCKGEM